MKNTNEKICIIGKAQEIDLAECKAKVKAAKRKITFKTALTVGEAIGAGLVAGVCIGAAKLSFDDKNIDTSSKMFAAGIATIASGLVIGKACDAANAIATHQEVVKISKGINELIDMAIKIEKRDTGKLKEDSVPSDESTDSAICEVCNPVSNLNTTLNCIDENNEEIAKKQEENSAALDTLLDELNEHNDGKDDEVVDVIGSAITTAVENGDVDLEVKEDNIYLKKNTAKVSKSSPLLRFKRK